MAWPQKRLFLQNFELWSEGNQRRPEVNHCFIAYSADLPFRHYWRFTVPSSELLVQSLFRFRTCQFYPSFLHRTRSPVEIYSLTCAFRLFFLVFDRTLSKNLWLNICCVLCFCLLYRASNEPRWNFCYRNVNGFCFTQQTVSILIFIFCYCSTYNFWNKLPCSKANLSWRASWAEIFVSLHIF